jgi:hypothetical protein
MAKHPRFPEFARRLFIAQRRYELAGGVGLDRGELAGAVAKATGKKSLSDATVSQWFLGNLMPSIRQASAMASFLGVHPCWLAFGDMDVEEESLEPPPPPPPEGRPRVPAGRKR